MKVVGLTGGIASGKSTVAKMFAARGAMVASADADARAVLAVGEETREAVLAAFPEARAADGSLDRVALATRIFADAEARQQLNALTHPAIRRRMWATIEAARAHPASSLLVYEVPLLFEGGLETWFDATIATLASETVQAQRLQAREAEAGRPPLTPVQLAHRLQAQMPNSEKARRATYVVHTDIPLKETEEQVETIWKELTTADT